MSIGRHSSNSKFTVIVPTSNTGASISDVKNEYMNNYAKYIAYARLLTTSLMNAEDLVQQAFFNTVDRIKNGNTIHSETLSAYIKSAIRNISISTHRRTSAQPHLWIVEEHQSTPDAQHLLAAEKKVVVDAIADLTNTQRTVTVMYYFEGLKVDEIAKELSMGESAVKTHLFRARKHLSNTIESNDLFKKDA